MVKLRLTPVIRSSTSLLVFPLAASLVLASAQALPLGQRAGYAAPAGPVPAKPPLTPEPPVAPPPATPIPTPLPSPGPAGPVAPPAPTPTPTAPSGPGNSPGTDTPGNPAPKPGQAPAATPAPTPTATPAPKEIDDIVKGYDKVPGLWTLYRKVEDNHQKLLAELTQADLDHAYLMQSTLGSGDAAQLVTGLPAGDVVLKWIVTPDDRLVLTTPNLWYRTHDPNLTNAVQRDFPPAFLGVFPVIAKQASRKSLLVDVSGLFDGSVTGIDTALQAPPIPNFKGNSYGLDPKDTFYTDVKNFPTNMVVSVQYSFKSDGKQPVDTLADSRSFPVKVDYNLYALPDDTDVPHGYHPRLADPRVGFFINGQLCADRVGFESLDNDAATDPTVRYINRWRMEKTDPTAKLSPPVKPIVFYLDNSIPEEYRDAVRQGILMWNRAFERLGYTDSVQVKDAPNDPSWDTADMRNNVVRWVTSPPSSNGAYAIALMRENPVTGEILNASINVNANFARIGYREKMEVIDPLDVQKGLVPEGAGQATGEDAGSGNGGAVTAFPTKNFGPGVACELDGEMHDQAMWGRDALIAAGVPIDDTRYVQELLRQTVGHEFGHVLGLRHNFIASAAYTPQQLADPKFVSENGISASLMDYVGFNVFGIHTGADYFSRTPGHYDLWAIEYGYKDVPAATEKADLAKIASRGNEPGLTYQTDELADNYDPTIVRYDLSSDPLAYFAKSLNINQELLHSLLQREPKSGESYDEFTERLRGLLGNTTDLALMSSRFIGGAYVRRAVRGDIGAPLPFQPVPAATQRRALRLLDRAFFADSVWNLPESYYSHTGADPFANDDKYADNAFPLRDGVARVRGIVLAQLLSGERLARMANLEYKFPEPGATMSMIELFPTLRQAVWGPLPANVVTSALQRELQRTHVQLLIALEKSQVPNAPPDARDLAENELRQIRASLIGPRQTSPDVYTRLHFAEAIRRIDTALKEKLE